MTTRATARAATSALLAAAALAVLARPAAAEEKGPDGYDGDAVGHWLEMRSKNAAAGDREIIRVPLVARSAGWGCTCPSNFVGLSPDSHGGGETWVSATFAKGAEIAYRSEGSVVVAEGYLTGKTTTETGDAGTKYKLWGFEVLRTRPLKKGDKDEAVYLVLSGPEAKKDVPPLADGRNWLVISASIALADKDGAKKAEEARAKLVAAGFPLAEIIDSRAAPLLFCCYQVVIAGRFATEKDATALAKDAKALKVAVYVKKGW
jgi:hypothetical protein